MILMLSIVTIGFVSIHPTNAYTYISTLEIVNPPGQTALAPSAMQYSPNGEFTAEIISCGLGYPQNFTASVIGKIALIQRGDLTFQTKTLNAAAAGAVAVIIYNNIAGDLHGTLMAVTPIPAVGITQAEGQQLLDLLMLGPVTVHLTVLQTPGDVNGDGKVDGLDVAVVAQAFGSYPGHPRWNPDADLNGDGIIDGKDITFVAKNFGKTYP